MVQWKAIESDDNRDSYLLVILNTIDLCIKLQRAGGSLGGKEV